MTQTVKTRINSHAAGRRVVRWLRNRSMLASYDGPTHTVTMHVTKYGEDHARETLNTAKALYSGRRTYTD
jgi:hypothetical protein